MKTKIKNNIKEHEPKIQTNAKSPGLKTVCFCALARMYNAAC